eukprot:8518293-Pyramimonas_sp.AAC.1
MRMGGGDAFKRGQAGWRHMLRHHPYGLNKGLTTALSPKCGAEGALLASPPLEHCQVSLRRAVEG